MKQSEYKKQMKEFRSQPLIQTVIKCENKKYSKEGCYCCWSCTQCGRTGCDNLIYGDKVEYVNCDLEIG